MRHRPVNFFKYNLYNASSSWNEFNSFWHFESDSDIIESEIRYTLSHSICSTFCASYTALLNTHFLKIKLNKSHSEIPSQSEFIEAIFNYYFIIAVLILFQVIPTERYSKTFVEMKKKNQNFLQTYVYKSWLTVYRAFWKQMCTKFKNYFISHSYTRFPIAHIH